MNLSNYNNPYILIRGNITIIEGNKATLKYHLKIVPHLQGISEKLMEQQ